MSLRTVRRALLVAVLLVVPTLSTPAHAGAAGGGEKRMNEAPGFFQATWQWIERIWSGAPGPFSAVFAKAGYGIDPNGGGEGPPPPPHQLDGVTGGDLGF